MGLEAGNGFITGLVATNPVGATDPKSQGDDHIRLIKAALLGSFAAIGGAVTLSHTQINDAAQKSVANVFSQAGANLQLIQSSIVAAAYLGLGTNSVARGYFFAASSAGDVVAGSVLGDVGLRAQSGSILLSTDGGTTLNHKFTASNTTTTLNGVAVSDFARLSQANVFTALQTISGAGGQLLNLKGTTTPDPSAYVAYLDSVGTRRGYSGFGNADSSLRIVNEINLGTLRLLTTGGGAITLNGVDVTDYARKSQGNTFIGAAQSISQTGNPNWRATDGTTVTAKLQVIDGASGLVGTESNHPFSLYTNNTDRLAISSGGNFDFKAGTVTTNNASASEVGFKGVPIGPLDQAGSFSTFTLAHAGTQVRYTGTGGHTFTYPANGSIAYPIGTVLVVTNLGSASLAIALTTDTLQLAGTTTTGSRTLAQGGQATLFKADTTKWFISGPGVS